MTKYHALDVKDVLKSLETSEKGLTEAEAKVRLDKYGINEIERTKKISPVMIFLRQYTSFIVMILIAATVISALIGQKLEALTIIIIVIINGIFGFVSEYRAEKAIEALRKLIALKARVIRDGKETEIDSKELVPGDIILLETGDKVPADARLLEIAAFQVDEASLTGESVPSKKHIETLKKDTHVADQKNMVFMSAIITKGHAKAVVTNTGMKTEIGKIAEMVQEVKEKLTPLQEKLKQFGKWLGLVTIGICAFVFIVRVLREYIVTGFAGAAFISETFLVAVALAVAAIPEALPAIVTLTLGLGVQRMVKRNALIRQLPAVETLGCTNIICSDKTGTLTKNEMTVREIYTNNKLIKVSGEGYSPVGKFTSNGQSVRTKEIESLLRIGVLCNDARLIHNEKWEIFGDPTEGSLIVSAEKIKLKKAELERKFPRINELPFDSVRKCMTTIHRINREEVAYVKGAPDELLKKCKSIYNSGKITKLTEKEKKKILDINQDMANKALRVLGFAYRPLIKGYNMNEEEIEKNLTFVGLQAMIDPPREEIKESIKKCETAGIKTVLITGDHEMTAVAIAKELGLYKGGDVALTGKELDEMSDKEFERIVDKIVIYARVSPEHKVRILDTLKNKGHIVAMTGDGVNDAPALKKADIGVAMGITGTEVAKEASDMVLTDDNFTSIVNAVEEGRGIYNSIKQFVQYTLSSNLGEILVIFIAILIGWPLPLIAIQILWVNLLTDGLPGLALGLDPFDKEIMKRPPRKKKEEIIDKEVITNILIVGVLMCIGTLSMFYGWMGHEQNIEVTDHEIIGDWSYKGSYFDFKNENALTEIGGEDNSIKAKLGILLKYPMSIAFTVLIIFQLFNVLTYRAKTFAIDAKTSKFLIGSVIISVLMQFAVLYTPLNIAFKTVPLGFMDWIYTILVASTLYITLETRKVIVKRRAQSSTD